MPRQNPRPPLQHRIRQHLVGVDGKGRGGGKGKEKSEDCARKERPPLACRPSPPQGGRDRPAPARTIFNVELNSIFTVLRREGPTVPPPGLSPLVGEMGGSPEGVLRQIDAFAFGTPNGLIARHAPHPAHSAAAARGRAARRAGAPMRRRRSLKDTAPPSIISTAPPQIARITGFHQSRTTIPPSGRSSPSET